MHHHLLDSEKKDQIHHLNVQITNHLCVQTENVLETKIIVELNYHVQMTNLDVKIKLVDHQKIYVLKN
jgi:hypothetical protein